MVSTRSTSTRLVPPLRDIQRRIRDRPPRQQQMNVLDNNLAVAAPPVDPVVDPQAGDIPEPALPPLENPPPAQPVQIIPQARVPAPTAVTFAYGVDPFENDINPATSDGQKLWLRATESRDTKLSVTQKNVTEFMAAIETDSNNFAWGELVNLVPVSPTERKSIVKEYNSITLQQVQSQAFRIWGDKSATFNSPLPDAKVVEILDPARNLNDRAIFYLRVRSKMIAKRLQNSIDDASWKSLLQKQTDFAWLNQKGNYDYDGPTMLKILLSTVNPATRVGVKELRKAIRTARLPRYKHDVQAMLDNMNNNYLKIIRKEESHDNYEDDLFEALLSSKNDIFRNYIQRLQDEWESGKDITPGDIMELALRKYNNMLERKIWIQSETQESKLVALATKLQQMESQMKNQFSSSSSKSNNSSVSNKKKHGIDEWRMVKKGESKVVNGTTYWWCPHHKVEGKYDGLYMTHKPSEHSAWKKDRDKRNEEWKAKRRGKKDASGSTGSQATKLIMSDKLKSVLTSHLSCSDADAEAVWKEFSQDFP